MLGSCTWRSYFDPSLRWRPVRIAAWSSLWLSLLQAEQCLGMRLYSTEYYSLWSVAKVDVHKKLIFNKKFRFLDWIRAYSGHGHRLGGDRRPPDDLCVRVFGPNAHIPFSVRQQMSRQSTLWFSGLNFLVGGVSTSWRRCTRGWCWAWPSVCSLLALSFSSIILPMSNWKTCWIWLNGLRGGLSLLFE